MDIADQAWMLSTPTTDRRLGDVHFDDIVAARELLARTLDADAARDAPAALAAARRRSARQARERRCRSARSSCAADSTSSHRSLLRNARAASSPRRAAITANRSRALRSAHGDRVHRVCSDGEQPRQEHGDRRARRARAITIGHDFDAAWQAAKEHAAQTGAIAGASDGPAATRLPATRTVALEMLDQASQPLDTVFVPIGGGSLAAGMGLVFKALSPHTAGYRRAVRRCAGPRPRLAHRRDQRIPGR